MKKIAFIVIGVLASFLLSSMLIPAVNAADNKDKVIIPNEWHGKHKVVIPRGDLVEVIYIRYADDSANSKPADQGQRGGNHNGYEISGLHWASTGVSYFFNPSFLKEQGLSPRAVETAIKSSFEAWNGVVPELYAYGGISKAVPDLGLESYDQINVITWTSISDPTVVAMSIMWYHPDDLTLVDCDIVFNTHFAWGIDPDGEGPELLTGNKYDIQDICTHEAGHWTGLNDLYAAGFWPMTMYGYASYRETYKISLEKGDVRGVQQVYPLWT